MTDLIRVKQEITVKEFIKILRQFNQDLKIKCGIEYSFVDGFNITAIETDIEHITLITNAKLRS